MARKKRWQDLSRNQQALAVTGAAVEVALTTVALIDLARRPSTQVRGAKALWALGCLVQPVGPITYLLIGRQASN